MFAQRKPEFSVQPLWNRTRTATPDLGNAWRVAEIDARLVKIHKEGAVIKRHCHCFASDAEIRAEVPKYEKELDDAAAAGNEIHDELNEGR
jgi:hypothetical protein